MKNDIQQCSNDASLTIEATTTTSITETTVITTRGTNKNAKWHKLKNQSPKQGQQQQQQQHQQWHMLQNSYHNNNENVLCDKEEAIVRDDDNIFSLQQNQQHQQPQQHHYDLATNESDTNHRCHNKTTNKSKTNNNNINNSDNNRTNTYDSNEINSNQSLNHSHGNLRHFHCDIRRNFCNNNNDYDNIYKALTIQSSKPFKTRNYYSYQHCRYGCNYVLTSLRHLIYRIIEILKCSQLCDVLGYNKGNNNLMFFSLQLIVTLVLMCSLNIGFVVSSKIIQNSDINSDRNDSNNSSQIYDYESSLHNNNNLWHSRWHVDNFLTVNKNYLNYSHNNDAGRNANHHIVQGDDKNNSLLKNGLMQDDFDDDSKQSPGHHYTHTWAVHIPDGDNNDLANLVAQKHGFINLGKIFNDHYHFAHRRVSKRSLTPAAAHQRRLEKDVRVQWAVQQVAKSRRKRDFIRVKPPSTSTSLVDAVSLSDPKWAHMWYLNRGGGLDMNVIPAWKEGITGKGIVVTILDDGLESDHPDIINNYDPKASYDVNSHDADPMPHYDLTDSNRHGTRCAGEVAATANNSICAVGIAFGARVGGVRMLDGDVTDAVEARSLSLNPQHIDIYSASWGPDDDGKTVDGPGELASRAFIEGVTKGRAGKGSIFIWASGNGGRELDNCNCDGYTNSIWTLSISSATEEGHVPWYSEKCSSTLATTYSSGGQAEKQVVTTDLHHSCTVSHTGTSASAPLAAGIAALVLESNQNLTWRDLQHIVVRTAKPANLKDPTWSKNGVGRRISHSFGYGLMDAAGMVNVARTWKTVPEQQRCEINAPHVDKVIPPKSHITLQQTVKYCSINFLEHVQAKITLTSQRRGDILLNLISPAGTKVTLLTPRIHDVSRSGFNQWPFMSVHTWGESPHGNWQLEIHNEGRYMAQITQWDLIFYGTEMPAQPNDPPPTYNNRLNSPYGNIMEHNDIEYDSSGQWHNMQQIGDTNMMSNDRTNSSCLKTTINQHCLACAPPTYFYNGRCYDKCPNQTYAITENDPSDIEKINDNNRYNNQNQSRDYKEILQSLNRKRRNSNLFRYLNQQEHVQQQWQMQKQKQQHHEIYINGETKHNNKTYIKATSQLSCSACDKSCRQCYGPLNSQCTACFPGSQMHNMLNRNETYCYTFAERSSGNNQIEGNRSKGSPIPNSISVGLLIVLLIVLLIPCCITITVVLYMITANNSNNNSLTSMTGTNRNCCCYNSLSTFQRNDQSASVVVKYDRVNLITNDNDDGDIIDEANNSNSEDNDDNGYQPEINAKTLAIRNNHYEVKDINCMNIPMKEIHHDNIENHSEA